MNITNDIKKTFNNPFIALKHENFRYYWIGMCVSLIGTWMQNIAQPWLAYTLTNSPFLLSLIGIVQFTPMLILSLFAGVIIDKFSKKKILLLLNRLHL
jgi:MFS family permease